jgi:hypothetical protein
MYRSSNETHLARIATLEQQLAEAREAMDAAGIERPRSDEEKDRETISAFWGLVVVLGGIFALWIVVVIGRGPEEPPGEYSVTLDNLPSLGAAPSSAPPAPQRVLFEVP